MPESDPKRFAVEKYLEQVKVLTALATTLLLTPNVVLVIAGSEATRGALDQALPSWRSVALHANVAFLVAIGLTYFIYSSLVGQAHEGEFDVYRPMTRLLSLLQFGALVWGCVALLRLLTAMLV